MFKITQWLTLGIQMSGWAVRALVVMMIFLALPISAQAAGDEPKVYSPTPTSAFYLYAFDPELLAGWTTPLRAYEKRFIPEKYQQLPILGGWYGEGFIPDREMLLGHGLKKAFFIINGFHEGFKVEAALKELGLEVMLAPGELTRTGECFRAMGQHFNRPERGLILAEYSEQVLGAVKAAVGDLPKASRPTIYLAFQTDGLATICRGSYRDEAMDLAGGLNVHECLPGTENSTTRLTFEQLMSYDPDVILVFNPDLAKSLPHDPRWQRLQAVREGRTYLVPRGPFSWLERPATFMRLIGVQWLANILHPNLYKVDMIEEIRRFVRLFFNVELSNEEAQKILRE